MSLQKEDARFGKFSFKPGCCCDYYPQGYIGIGMRWLEAFAMFQKVREFLMLPEYEDDDQNLAARLLSAILIAVVGLTFFLTFPLALMLPRGNQAIALQGVVALLFSAALYYLLRSRRVVLASWSLISLFWALNLLSVWTGGGISSSAYSNFMLLILTAGLLLGARAGVIFTILSGLFGFVMVIAEDQGFLTIPIVQQTTFTRWFGSVAIFTMIALLQGFASNNTRMALKKARDAEVRYRTLVEQIPAITYMDHASRAGVTEYVSPQVIHLLGIQPEEWIKGKIDFWLALIHAEDREAARAAYLQSAESGIPFNLEYRMLARDGKTLWVHDKAFVLPDARGKPEWIHGVIFDVTERKRAELEREKLIKELEAKNTEMERFVYTVSHDLKSPIVTIVGFLGYVEEDVQKGNLESFRKDIDRVYQAAFKMQNLLKDLLELSRIGRMMNEPEVVSFDALVNEALELTDGRLQERGVRVRVDPNLPKVYGDGRRLLELVQNLIDNAAKYMGNQPEPLIEIGTKGFEGSRPIFFVSDNGIGIAPKYHDQVFGLFNKLDPNMDGTGVGLAIAKRIVEFHGGRIWVESEAGRGACFYFTLQIQPHPAR